MSIELEIYFVDLVGYHINSDAHLWALLPNVAGHIPILAYYDSHGRLQLFPVRNRHVELHGDTGIGVDWDDVTNPPEFPSDPRTDFGWVTQLEAAIHPAFPNCRLDPALVAPSPPSPDEKISSRFVLKGGEIKTERFVADDDGDICSFKFPMGSSWGRRAMVAVCRLSRQLNSANDAQLALETFGNAESIPPLTLHQYNGKVSCVYGNLATAAGAASSHFPFFIEPLQNTDRPRQGELVPTKKSTTTMPPNPQWDGILNDLKGALLGGRAGERAVYVDPERCPQGNYP